MIYITLFGIMFFRLWWKNPRRIFQVYFVVGLHISQNRNLWFALNTARRETLWIFKKLWECWLLSESTVNILEFYWSVCSNHQLKNARRPPSLFVFFVLLYGHKYAYVKSNNGIFIFLLRTYHKFIYSSHQKFLTACKIPRFF